MLNKLFQNKILVKGNQIHFDKPKSEIAVNQKQTEEIFSDKWTQSHKIEEIEKLYNFQFEWFLKLYGFSSENEFADYLSKKTLIIDAGCGLGYKSSWIAKLAPHAIVIGIDISEAIEIAALNYAHIPNLFFLRADIANTGIKNDIVEFVLCDQVIMHTEDPEKTFQHLSSITKTGCEFACYMYAKKALPRELIDDYFRTATHNITAEEMWKFSEQLTELGKRLTDLKVEIESPEITLLGIKPGKYDIQRFIYWNFLKCFWREDWGFELSRITNFDWYAPSNAKRYSKVEIENLCTDNCLEIGYFHEEEACYSGRFKKL
jgi:SAM-dependent methyltransferase